MHASCRRYRPADPYLKEAIKVCEKTNERTSALRSFRESVQLRLNPSLGDYVATIGECGNRRHWQRAVWLVSEMVEAMLESSVKGCNAGISACGKAKQWHQAVRLLREAREETLELNAIFPTTAGISACEKCEQWQRALALLSEVWQAKLEPDVFSLLQRWDQCVRERHAVAASSGVVHRCV
ncbi:unnamed protein product [Prorocentrum cordatum]|uniref:FAT domain-containing protein n=1 Tax=Prorocentrum cordatum TaxID=2364126 RepID=A0ABN9SSJ6_9DINO|nr:unnamed protein product [Polarella glacialis]